MSLRALLVAGVLTLPALAACSRAVDRTALPDTTAAVAPAEPAELAGGPDAIGDAALRAAMDAAVAEALIDAERPKAPPTVLVISNAPIPNPGDPVRASGVLRVAMRPVPNPEAAPRAAPALLGAPDGEPAPAMELAGAPETPRRVGAMLEVASAKSVPAARPAKAVAAARPKPAAGPAPLPAAEPAPAVAPVVALPPATPMEAVIATAAAAPPAPEEIELPRVAAGVTPADTGVTFSPLMWLSGLALFAVALVFAAVRLARRDKEPLRA